MKLPFLPGDKDHHFNPTELEVPGGQMIAVVVKNLDPTSEEFECDELRREKVVPGGQEVTVYIRAFATRPICRYEYVGNFNPGAARKTSLEGSPTFKVNYSNTYY